MGSVKDLQIIKKPTSTDLGVGDFVFSDRYSVFDWGEMPNHVDDKGAALCIMGAKSFELLESQGVNTHYIGLIEDGKVKQLDELNAPTNIMRVKLTNVIRPKYISPRVGEKKGGYDYSFFVENQGKLDNYLIPLECIYRNALPLGSSVFGKLVSGKLKLSDLGLTEQPVPGTWLPEPKYDFSTKLEDSGDRPVKGVELYTISGLSEDGFTDLEDKLVIANNVITNQCKKVGMENYDGKFEFMKYGGEIVFVDVLGTPDECRFGLGSQQVSKEVIRQWYRKKQPEWSYAIPFSKKIFGDKWKSVMIENDFVPKTLPNDFHKLVCQMYPACANAYSGLELFDVPKLSVVMDEMGKTPAAIYVKG